TRSGILVLGVNDKTRQVTGIPLDRLDHLESYVRELCHDSIEPPLPVHIFRMELPDETGTPRPILKVEVSRSLYVHRSPGGYFHRIGSSKRELRPEQLARLFQQRSQALIMRFDEQAVPGTSAGDLDETLIDRFVGLP